MGYDGMNEDIGHVVRDWDIEHGFYDPAKEDKGEGCEACGNPDYPNCMDSCPLFDD